MDLGYSAKSASCGVASSTYPEGKQLQFGKAIGYVRALLEDAKQPVLVLEGVLSTLHSQIGNPMVRGEFERGRGWYWGPGAVSLLAARRFLERLAADLDAQQQVALAEAFLSNKPRTTSHAEDARVIAQRFWETSPERTAAECEPILPAIDGVPSVRVFQAPG